MKTHLCKFLLLVIISVSISTAATAALVNGGFEVPVVTSNLNFTGAFSFSGWSGFSTGTGGGGGNAGIVVGTDFGLAPLAGNQHFSFNGDNPPPGTYLEQTFSTIPGQGYDVAFGIGRNSGAAQQTLTLNVQVFNTIGNELASLIAHPPATVSYSNKSFSFIANSATSRLRFTDASSSNPNTDVFIDAVSVVPEAGAGAQLLVTPLSLDFGTLVTGQSNTQSFSVINNGGQALTGTATVAGPFIMNSGSPYVITPGQTGIVNVSFIPISAGAFTNTAVFNSNGGISSNQVTGVGLTPGALGVSPISLSFGAIVTGSTAQASFVVTNTGSTAINGTASVGGAPFSILSGTPFNLAGFRSTNVTVQFAPTSAGTVSNNVVFASTGGNSTNLVTGTGAVAPSASFHGTPTNGLAPLVVTFTDTSTGTITNRFWNFGNNQTTTTLATNIIREYLSTGTNTVTLIVSGPLGVSTNTMLGYIIVLNSLPCSFSVAPTNASFSASGGSSNVVLTASGTNCAWNANSNDGFISITSSTNGTGSGGITYLVAANVSTNSRIGTLIIAGQTHTVLQAGAVVSDTTPPLLTILSPTENQSFTNANISVNGTANDANGIKGVTVGGAPVDTLVVTNWSKALTLLSGTNSIVVIATDNSANMNATTQTVHAILIQPAQDTDAPAVPTGVIASAQNCTNILIAWNTSTDSGGSGLAGYKVYRDNVFVTNTVVTNWLDTAVSSSNNYCYQVSAYDNAANASTLSVQSCTNTPVCGECDLTEALDTQSLPWVWSNALWECQNGITHDGVDAAISAVTADGQTNLFSTTVTGPGTLRFWWKVSSETNADFLSVSIDGVEQSAVSGEVDWQQKTVMVSSNDHVLACEYIKNASGAMGMDAGFVDEIEWVPGPSSPLGLASSSIKPKCKNDVCSLKGKLTFVNESATLLGPTMVRLYLSDDTAYDSGDVLLNEAPVNGVKIGKKWKLKLKATLSSGMTVTGKYILVVVGDDPDRRVLSVYGPLP